MIMFKDFAGNARKKKKKKQAKKKVKKLTMQVKMAQGRQVFEYIGRVIKPAAEREKYYVQRRVSDVEGLLETLLQA